MKRYGEMSTTERKRREFEADEVFSSRGISSAIAPTGYDAYRVSPRTTEKYGKKYRKVYGASVEINYPRGTAPGAKGRPKVTWWPHGYVPATVKPGTRRLAKMGTYPVDQRELKRQLML